MTRGGRHPFIKGPPNPRSSSVWKSGTLWLQTQHNTFGLEEGEHSLLLFHMSSGNNRKACEGRVVALELEAAETRIFQGLSWNQLSSFCLPLLLLMLFSRSPQNFCGECSLCKTSVSFISCAAGVCGASSHPSWILWRDGYKATQRSHSVWPTWHRYLTVQ